MNLLSADAFGKFQELCDLYKFDTDGDENCREDWGSLIKEFDSEDEEIEMNNYERQIDIQNEFEERSIDERARRIAFDQLKAWSVYFEDKPLAKAAYHNFLVSIVLLFACNCDIVVVLSHIIYSAGAIQP